MISASVILIMDCLFEGEMLSAVTNLIQFNPSALCLQGCLVKELTLMWVSLLPVSFLLQSHFSGNLKKWRNAPRYRYHSVDTKANDLSKMPSQRTFSYPDALEFNYFDPDNVPELMSTYADIVFTTVQALASEFGFQVDNSRNQAEHLLMLLTNNIQENEIGGLAPATRLHARLFDNYRKWCDRIGCPPLFSKRLAGKAYHSLIEDMLIFLLIWGEAANLKHMPESLCYLFHKVMGEHINRQGRSISALYPGHFLDMVITPMFEVVAASLTAKGDHDKKKIYDDFNEFFWSPLCLNYQIKDSASGEDIEDNEIRASKNIMHISQGLSECSKTYLEKRSWLHPLLSFHRVFEVPSSEHLILHIKQTFISMASGM